MGLDEELRAKKPTPSPELEHACRAYWNAGVAVPRWDSQPEDQKEVVRYRMRAAILSLRDPTEAMCEEGWKQLPDSIADAWRAMIDAALAEAAPKAT